MLCSCQNRGICVVSVETMAASERRGETGEGELGRGHILSFWFVKLKIIWKDKVDDNSERH